MIGTNTGRLLVWKLSSVTENANKEKPTQKVENFADPDSQKSTQNNFSQTRGSNFGSTGSHLTHYKVGEANPGDLHTTTDKKGEIVYKIKIAN